MACLKAKLAEYDELIAAARVKRDEAEADLKALSTKRESYARIHCKHERTYQRSVMGREIDTYCEDCGVAL